MAVNSCALLVLLNLAAHADSIIVNPNDPSDANKNLNGGGNTNLEKYLNSITGEYSL
jgi:hypothetical protein